MAARWVLLALLLPQTGSRMSGVDLTSQLIFDEVEATTIAATVGPTGSSTPSAPSPTGTRNTGQRSRKPPASPGATDVRHDGSVRRERLRNVLKRIGARFNQADEEEALQSTLRISLRTVKMSLLRGVLFERGGSCTGCSERSEYVEAVLASLAKPLVARHALPLFLYDTPLFPHTQMGLNLFEPRYKLLCRKALKQDRIFGFVTGNLGTLAKIQASEFANGDVADGTCQMRILGTRRFRLGRHWEEDCQGCPHALHYADVTYLANDTDGGASADSWPLLVKDALRLHHAMTSTEAQRDLEAQLGEAPTTRDRGYAISMWLAGACSALSSACRAQAAELLATSSTVERLERIIKIQKAQMGQNFERRRG